MKTSRIPLLLLVLFCYGCAPFRAIRWWQPDLGDSSKFDKAIIAKSASPFRFIQAGDQLKYKKLKKDLDSVLVGTNTTSFVIIKNDSIIYENFAANMDAKTLHPSFSVAKSYVGTLVGIAVDKGMISSTNDLVIKYLPELEKNGPGFKKLTIQHVLDMRAGFDFNDDQASPFGAITRLYYGTSLTREMSKLRIIKEPGKSFEYQSIDTQLLAAILEKTTGQSLTTLLSTYLWSPLGAESDALWSLDDRKMAKAFCCLNATANDFAKLGRLYLKKGNWQGKQIVSKEWINASTNADTLFTKGYKNQFWACGKTTYFKDSVSADQALKKLKLTSKVRKSTNGRYYFTQKTNDFRAEGILGQIVYVNPDNDVIIVRTGDYPDKNIYFNGFIPDIGRKL